MARKPTVPRRDTAIYDALSARFRGGDLYAFSYDDGVWLTWRTEADWLATERNGRVQRPDLAAMGHGPTVHDRAGLVADLGIATSQPRRPGKAEYVALVRRILDGVDWTVDELETLLDREVAA